MAKLLIQLALILALFATGLIVALLIDKTVGLGIIGTAVGYAAALFQHSPIEANPAIPPGV